jgi:hypothetical protein
MEVALLAALQAGSTIVEGALRLATLPDAATLLRDLVADLTVDVDRIEADEVGERPPPWCAEARCALVMMLAERELEGRLLALRVGGASVQLPRTSRGKREELDCTREPKASAGTAAVAAGAPGRGCEAEGCTPARLRSSASAL